MKVKLLKPARVLHNPGDIIDLDEKEARRLIDLRVAVVKPVLPKKEKDD